MKYRLLNNVDKYDYERPENQAARAAGRTSHDGYNPGNRLIPYYEGTLDPDDARDPMYPHDVLFMRHNRDDRPCGQIAPSLSIGDVIVYDDPEADSLFGGTVFTCTSDGWAQIGSADDLTLVLDVTWREFVDAERASR